MKKIMEAERLKTLDSFIAYLENTNPEDWATDVVRTGKKNCLLGHLVNWMYGEDYKGNIMPAWDWFSEMWVMEYIFYPVNDGESPNWMNFKYDQPTAKERCIAYLKNLNDGKEKRTQELWDESLPSLAPNPNV